MNIDVIGCCRPLGQSGLTETEAEATAVLFKALGDPARVKLVNLLAQSDEPVCACYLVEPLGLSQPTVSHHLKKLTAAGLLDREQRGVWAFYSVNREAMARVAGLVQLNGGTDDDKRRRAA
jgi:ArsR family transcriptional regulator, arsenate/arsenite/antimonite-responsive transcriptional repressor